MFQNMVGKIFHGPSLRLERVMFTKLLWVYISDTLGAGKQNEYMLKTCIQQLYHRNQLTKQGLSQQKINNVLML